MFASKVGAYSSEGIPLVGRLWPYLQTLDKAGKDCRGKKHSSLLQTFIIYAFKKGL
jgi:hypothetical protein